MASVTASSLEFSTDTEVVQPFLGAGVALEELESSDALVETAVLSRLRFEDWLAIDIAKE